jgi:hypothetical protein
MVFSVLLYDPHTFHRTCLKVTNRYRLKTFLYGGSFVSTPKKGSNMCQNHTSISCAFLYLLDIQGRHFKNVLLMIYFIYLFFYPSWMCYSMCLYGIWYLFIKYVLLYIFQRTAEEETLGLSRNDKRQLLFHSLKQPWMLGIG